MKATAILSAEFGSSVSLLPLSDFLDPDFFDREVRYSPLDSELSVSTRVLSVLCSAGLMSMYERVECLSAESAELMVSPSTAVPQHRVTLPSGKVVVLGGHP